MFQISLQKSGIVCCGLQLSCGNGLHILPDFVLFFWVIFWLMVFVYMGTYKIGLLASLMGSCPWKLSITVAVAWRSSCWKPKHRAERLPKPFLKSIFKISKGTGFAGSGICSMINDRAKSTLFSSGLPVLPFSTELLVLLSAFSSLLVIWGQMRISAGQLLCILYCWNGLWCLMMLCVLPKKYYLCTGWEKNWQCLSSKLLSQRHSSQHNILGETSHPSSPLVWYYFHWAEYEYEAEYLPVELLSLRGEKIMNSNFQFTD